MKNKYAGKCCYCACYVEAGDGRCWKWEDNNRWYVACEECNEVKKYRAYKFLSNIFLNLQYIQCVLY